MGERDSPSSVHCRAGGLTVRRIGRDVNQEESEIDGRFRGPGTDPGEQPQHARAGEEIPRVLHQAEEGQEVSHVRGLHEAQPAVLVEGDAAPAQLHLEVEAVV